MSNHIHTTEQVLSTTATEQTVAILNEDGDVLETITRPVSEGWTLIKDYREPEPGEDVPF